MATLLNAAKYIAKDRGFSPVYNDEPMFDDPIVPASQGEAFSTLHLLLCLAHGTDPAYVSVKRVTDWLNSKAKSANV